ncbi:DUF2505 domain-containing protein [Jatrophihabitans endophyticus]|uniref:DUF2505 domain-containing protein n=1 Tax=Jatrophihabitans endophyticus TaxID=1206085 RepID=UPI0019EEDD73|nr:DUF2505 domain-containing protein [Jatrophihabitans endophyticus]MBE7189494.1 DUF2505 domain-containing protein [Jatrophihabitans endophyticus]
MKINRTLAYDLPPEDARAMSCDPAFQERKCADAGALDWNVRVTERPDGGTTISTRRTLPTTGFPSMLRKLLPAGMVSTEIIDWAATAEPDGTCTATLRVEFHGAPASMHGTIRVSPTAAGGSSITVDGEFKAGVPLIGGKVEKLAAPIIFDVIDSEQRTGRAWVADGV